MAELGVTEREVLRLYSNSECSQGQVEDAEYLWRSIRAQCSDSLCVLLRFDSPRVCRHCDRMVVAGEKCQTGKIL
jgi:hypothetical protein